VRGFVNRLQLIARFCNYLEVATSGINSSEDSSDGYLRSVSDNLRNAAYLQEVCDELNFLGHIRAAFAIVQKVRYTPGEQTSRGTPPKRPCECLPDHRKRLREVIRELGLREPSTANVMKALGEYKMFSVRRDRCAREGTGVWQQGARGTWR
jgi:hypothetical protein